MRVCSLWRPQGMTVNVQCVFIRQMNVSIVEVWRTKKQHIMSVQNYRRHAHQQKWLQFQLQTAVRKTGLSDLSHFEYMIICLPKSIWAWANCCNIYGNWVGSREDLLRRRHQAVCERTLARVTSININHTVISRWGHSCITSKWLIKNYHSSNWFV